MSSGSTVAVLSFQSDHPNLSEYLIDDITSGLVNTDLYTVVDRRSLEILAQEMAFQLSGEVSDETALAIGKRLGAQVVISGAITYLGDFYRLRVQAIEVETARIQGSQIVLIQPNRLLATLTGNPWTGPAEPEYAPPPAREPEHTAPVTAEPQRPGTAPVGPGRTPAPPSVANRFYLGLRGGFAQHLHYPNPEFWGYTYAGGEAVNPSFSMELSAQMSLQLANFFALQAETIFLAAGDTFELDYYAPSSSTYSASAITLSYSAVMLPVLGKFTFRPGSFLLAGFGGIYFTIPFTAMTLDVNGTEYSYDFTPPMGFIVGGNAGARLGPGTLFLDLRYAGDFNDIELTGNWGSRAVYKRSQVLVSLGYEFGLGRRGR
jgi:TolB-like protein